MSRQGFHFSLGYFLGSDSFSEVPGPSTRIWTLSQACWFWGALRWAAFSSESLARVSGERLHRLADICGLLQPNFFWHAALNARSQSMCWSAKHPQTVGFPICESFSVGPGFLSTWGVIIERHTDTSLRQSVILRTLNSSGGTWVPLSVSQTPPNSCSSVEVGTALISLQTKKCLCGVWLCTQPESKAQKQTCSQKSIWPPLQKIGLGLREINMCVDIQELDMLAVPLPSFTILWQAQSSLALGSFYTVFTLSASFEPPASLKIYCTYIYKWARLNPWRFSPMHKFMSLRKGRDKGLWAGSLTKVLLQKHGDRSSDPHQVHKSQGQRCTSANPTLRGETKTGDLRRPVTSQFSQMDELWV